MLITLLESNDLHRDRFVVCHMAQQGQTSFNLVVIAPEFAPSSGDRSPKLAFGRGQRLPRRDLCCFPLIFCLPRQSGALVPRLRARAVQRRVANTGNISQNIAEWSFGRFLTGRHLGNGLEQTIIRAAGMARNALEAFRPERVADRIHERFGQA